MQEVKKMLDTEVKNRNSLGEISSENPDPLLVATKYNDESIALVCALFAYGNVKAILKFLESLDFSLLESSDEVIEKTLATHYYRFQNAKDVSTLFIALKRLKEIDSIENIFYEGYKKEENLLDGVWNFIEHIKAVNSYESRGYKFLVGSVPKKVNSAGTYKRYLMYLRWMVRKDEIDLGLWSKIDKKDLLMPLDTHTFKVSQKLGLLKRKTYDMKAVLELTERLKSFDKLDPIKYDFALYRLGQEKLL
jgi:uncharacterized protein (TIGR02757 family)